MTGSLALPLWILAVVGALALWAALDRILMPSARWFLRRRLNRMIEEVNTRLELQIPPFLQTKRRVLIDQLTYDPQVMEAIDAEAQATGTPREVLSRQVERYAREIVPSFNAYAYFRIGYHVAQARGGEPLPGAPRLFRRRGAGPHRARRQRRLRHEPPQQHGLRDRRLHGGASLRAQLCRG